MVAQPPRLCNRGAGCSAGLLGVRSYTGCAKKRLRVGKSLIISAVCYNRGGHTVLYRYESAMFAILFYRLVWLALWVLRHSWWKWTITGRAYLRPRGQPMILAVNHLHWADTAALGASLPLALQPTWMAKAELFAHPVAAWWLRAIRVIPVSRGRHGLSALAAAEQALNGGAALIIFVEGHRSATGGLQEGQGGAVRLAARSGVPIVPIALWGTEAGLGGFCLRKPIHVSIGEPYYVTTDTSKISQQRMTELTDDLMLRMATLLPERYWGVYRERMERSDNKLTR
jgi:1-acyl-sn-glycerol-3-phosphate acyltransferase